MIVFHKDGQEDQIYLRDDEKLKLKKELTEVYNAGGRLLRVNKAEGNNCVVAYNNNKKIIAHIIGESAIIVSVVLMGINKNIFCGANSDIKQIIKKYCNV